jgi:CheY-like chemotaxis protein
MLYYKQLESNTQQNLYDQLVSRPAIDPSSIRPVRILYVDDEVGIHSVISDLILSRFDALFDTAKDGVEALEKLKKKKSYDLVLTDIMMPRMNGIDLNLEIRRLYPDTPVAFFTAFSEFEEQQPCAAYLLKPIDIDNMLNVFSDIFDESGLFRFSHSLFRDADLTYQKLYKCRDTIRRFLSHYKTSDFFETALRHKVKDLVRKFCMKIQNKITGHKAAEELRNNLLRLEKLMEQIRHGSMNGLRKVLQGVEEDVLSERPGVTISVSSLKRLPQSIAGKEAETFLAFCIIEFVGNALDAIKKKASIRVTIRNKKTQNALFVSVWNNGPEIPGNFSSTIFEEGISSKGKGRGMGLYIIKRLSERFGAEVYIDQTNGVQFSVILPVPS